MRKITAIIVGILFVSSFSYAETLTKESSWDEILSNKTVKAVFPSISVGNGKFVTYNHLFLDRDKLTTGGTWEDPVEFADRRSSDDKDRAPDVVRTVTRKTQIPLNYTSKVCTPTDLVHVQGNDSDYIEPLVCNPVSAQHPRTVNVKIYKKGVDTGSHDTKDHSGDVFLFTKTYSIPVYTVK